MVRATTVLVLCMVGGLAVACGSADDTSGDGGANGTSTGGGGMSTATGTGAGGTVPPPGGGGSASGSGGAPTGTGNTGTGAATGGVATGGSSGGSIGGSSGGSTGGSSGGSSGGTATGGGPAGSGGSPGSGGAGTEDPTPSSGCGVPTTLTSGNGSIDVNGVTREYILNIPDNYDPNQPYRLVFGWHQLAGSADMIARMGYYGVEGPSNGQAVLVAPQGLYQITPSSGNLDAGWWNNNGEDVEFYHAMLERFSSELCIDQERIFSVGFSFGAMFSFTLACEQDSGMRAIAPMAGGGGRCDQKVAVMGFVGTRDGLLSGHVGAIERFADSNGCSGEPVQMQPSWCDEIDDPTCTCVAYQNCDPGYPAVSCEYDNGHMFAPNSGQTIWDFFSQF